MLPHMLSYMSLLYNRDNLKGEHNAPSRTEETSTGVYLERQGVGNWRAW